jgi:DNA primase
MKTSMGAILNNSILASIKADLDIVNLARSFGFEVKDNWQGGVTDCPACGKKGHLFLYGNSQCYHCYMGGCNIHGDVISFIGLAQGISNSDACTWAIEHYGKGPGRGQQGGIRAEKKRPPSPASSQAPVSEIYQAFYSTLGMPDRVREYLTATRGLTSRSLDGFGLKGLLDPRHDLEGLKADFPEDKLVACGLLRLDQNGKPRPSIYGPCVVFPHFHEGQIVYLSFRALEGRIKTPCLPGVNKRIFNEDALNLSPSVYVFEGIINALSYVELSRESNVIATLGVMSRSALSNLRSQHPGVRLILAYDPDDAGLGATDNLGLEYVNLQSWCHRLGFDGIPAANGKTWDMNDFLVDHRENFEERAAIMEFEGGLSRSEAETSSRDLLRKRR